jgi:hypothetical protein
MRKNGKQAYMGTRIVVVLTCFIFAAFFFITYLKKSSDFENRETLILETNDCLAAGDWNCAEKNVRTLLNATPNDTNLQLHLAGILFEQGRYKECVYYIQSLNFKNKDLDYLVEKSSLLEQEMEKLGVEKSMHFRLEFDGSPAKKDVMEALAVLEVAFDSLSDLFGFVPENKMCVVLYQEKEHQGVGPRPEWVGAIFDGKLRIPVNMMAYREVYRPVIFHELTHAFVRSMTRAELPFWLNEGIAQVIDASHNNDERPKGAAPNLKTLTEQFVKHNSSEMATKLYWYSQKMVEELLIFGGGGKEVFRKFAQCMQDVHQLGFDVALRKHFAVTSEKLLESVR